MVHRLRSVVEPHVVILRPLPSVPASHLPLAAPVIVSGQEGLVALAHTLESLQLTGAADAPLAVFADVKRYHPDGVACDEILVPLLIIERESEYSVQFLDEVHALVAIEREYHLTVAARAESVFSGIARAYLAVVVYLPVHRENLFSVGREQRLSSALRVDDRQPFMTQYGRPSAVNAAPVRSAVPYLPRHAESLCPQRAHVALYIKYGSYSTHTL